MIGSNASFFEPSKEDLVKMLINRSLVLPKALELFLKFRANLGVASENQLAET